MIRWWQKIRSLFRSKTSEVVHDQGPVPVCDEPETVDDENKVRRPKIYTKSLKRDVTNVTMNFLDCVRGAHLSFSNAMDKTTGGVFHAAHLHVMSGDYLYLGEESDRLLGRDMMFLDYGDEEVGEMLRALGQLEIDVGFFKMGNDYLPEEGDKFTLIRVTKTSLEEIDETVEITERDCLAYFYVTASAIKENGRLETQPYFGAIDKNGNPVSATGSSIRFKNKKWEFGYRMSPENISELKMFVKLAVSASLTKHYEWHVAFGSEDGPRALLPMNPGGCFAMFRDREKKGDRREALKHWVSEHWRETKESLAYVAQHLRGATRFDWRGLPCEILVSEHDLQMNEIFRNNAAAWRSRRPTNRIRVRVKKQSYSNRLNKRLRS